jgi:hypothetical protein
LISWLPRRPDTDRFATRSPTPEPHNRLRRPGGSSEGRIDGSDEVYVTEGLAEHYCVRLAHPNRFNVAANEYMCERPRAQYFLDGGNTASAA